MALIIKCNKLTTRDHHSLPNNQRKVVTIKNQPFWQSVDHRAPLSINPVQFNIGCSTGWSLWALVVGKPTHVSEGHSMTQVGGGAIYGASDFRKVPPVIFPKKKTSHNYLTQTL